MNQKRKAIIFGRGAFAELVALYLENDSDYNVVAFCETPISGTEYLGKPLVDFAVVENFYDPAEYDMFIAVGYRKMNQLRKRTIVNKLVPRAIGCCLTSQAKQPIGGNAKPLSVFRTLYEIFDPKEDYNVYVAQKSDEFTAGLLVFYYKEYCEYFTPVINQKYRSEQPLSLLIFTAMKEAYKRRVKYWNWGGTWPTHQEGVYLFKKRWGADERTYNYYTKIFDPEALKKTVDLYPQSCHFFYLKNLRNNNEDQAQ